MPIPQFVANTILTASQLNVMVDAINAGGAVKIEKFTASGTFTPPAGVTYAIAYILAGGGSTGTASVAAGGTSSVAFAAGTVSATGGNGMTTFITSNQQQSAGQANSGFGGATFGTGSGSVTTENAQGKAQDGALITAGGVVTPSVGITVTVGAGGAAGTNGAAGGSGYVYIEYAGG